MMDKLVQLEADRWAAKILTQTVPHGQFTSTIKSRRKKLEPAEIGVNRFIKLVTAKLKEQGFVVKNGSFVYAGKPIPKQPQPQPSTPEIKYICLDCRQAFLKLRNIREHVAKTQHMHGEAIRAKCAATAAIIALASTLPRPPPSTASSLESPFPLQPRIFLPNGARVRYVCLDCHEGFSDRKFIKKHAVDTQHMQGQVDRGLCCAALFNLPLLPPPPVPLLPPSLPSASTAQQQQQAPSSDRLLTCDDLEPTRRPLPSFTGVGEHATRINSNNSHVKIGDQVVVAETQRQPQQATTAAATNSLIVPSGRFDPQRFNAARDTEGSGGVASGIKYVPNCEHLRVCSHHKSTLVPR
eukprot:c667_g1_i1.p1 GENE.c667_g1_i1~~c667_g1_i1.p1  ORF type:complete len:353 (-),score=37.04 c667_g1_i1:174-1232(-)